jgi:hypothetical protein
MASKKSWDTSNKVYEFEKGNVLAISIGLES